MTENTTDAEELIAASTETPDAAAGAADTPAAPESTPDSAEDAEVVEDQGDNPNKRKRGTAINYGKRKPSATSSA